MYITLPISESKSLIDPTPFSVLSGEEETQLIVRLTGDWEALLRDILKAAPFDVVLVKETFSILRLRKRFSWLLG